MGSQTTADRSQRTLDQFHAMDMEALLLELQTSPKGLASATALTRSDSSHHRWWMLPKPPLACRVFASQFRSPITLMLIATAVFSVTSGRYEDASIILLIVIASAMLGFWQEYAASHALASLLAKVKAKVRVLRDGIPIELAGDEVVPGDVLLLSAGSTIPADCRLLQAEDVFVNESTLTGESFPVEKHAGRTAPDAPMAGRNNILFHGSHVISGTAVAVAVRTGSATELGRISKRLRLGPAESNFDLGVRRFGLFLMEVKGLLVLGIFLIHMALNHPLVDSLLFSLALSVGLTPQLLPAIIAVNLSHGAKRLAASKVIVRRLSSIENFGSMDVLCCDKTGTLTEGVVVVESCVDFEGNRSDRGLWLAGANAALESGFSNPIDDALRSQFSGSAASLQKLDEIPYDFHRKRLSVLFRSDGSSLLVTKGALTNILQICTHAQSAKGDSQPISLARQDIEQHFERFGREGCRVIAVACKELPGRDRVAHQDESEMTFVGLLVLRDPLRSGMRETLSRLRDMGVQTKIITGDNRVVAASIAAQAGLRGESILTGSYIHTITDEALMRQAPMADVFAEIEPNQKERIVLALKRSGEVVGYMGDGINDATALRAADVGISVDKAVDVAKEAADIILMQHDLNVLLDGIVEGRATFANTLKYIYMATSANFGKMLSMAGLSLFLPYLPLLPKQILLTNLLTDLPEMAIAKDHVDPELLRYPQRWNLGSIQRFMIVFGLLSSVFDYVTFFVLLVFFQGDMTTFRTGWFIESVLSACIVVLVLRSRRPFWLSPPAIPLVGATTLVIAFVIALPFTPLAAHFGFSRIDGGPLVALLFIVAIYAIAAEWLKQWFFRPQTPRASSGLRQSNPSSLA
jgi:Mg2+-importing ATPase